MQTFKKILLAATVATIASAQLFAASPRRGFAVVIDARSYEEARRQVDDYAAEIGKSGLEVHFVIDRTGQPDSLRQVLRQLWGQPKAPIEGAVLIGDIPVVMVRDAQHLTSAFKMDQAAFDRWESSVPSDRFYDDFSLEFAPLGRDSLHPGCFYYSLTAESAQRTRPDIYSGRIRPTDCSGTSRYEKLRSYLEKVVEAKRNPEPVDQILFFSGNGFISESMVARIDEKATLFEHFPWLERQRSGISYIDHKRDAHIKPRLMNEMQRRDLDFAVLHHHGDWDTEYLNNLPMTNDTKQQIMQIKMYLRESMRHAISHDIPADSAGRASHVATESFPTHGSQAPTIRRPGPRIPSTSGIWTSTSRISAVTSPNAASCRSTPASTARSTATAASPTPTSSARGAPSPCWPTR